MGRGLSLEALLNLVSRTLLAALLVALAVPAARAAEPCDGIRLVDGQVGLGVQLPVDADVLASPIWAGCLDAVGARLAQRPTIRAVTVAVRMPELDRGDRDPLKIAQGIAARLGTALGSARVSAVAPRPRVGEAANVQIAYVERVARRPVAQIIFAGGAVSSGFDESTLSPAHVGQLLGGSELLKTGPGAVSVIRLTDGSQVWVAPGSLVRLKRAVVEPAGRTVEIELFEGNAEVIATPGRGTFDVVTPAAIAGVRGTEFRVAVVPAGSRLETLGGGVELGAGGEEVLVDAGKGSRAKTGGTPEEPRDLLVAPVPLTALHGRLKKDEALSWTPIDGAARYEVLLARDTAFARELRVLVARGERTALPADLAQGKWFWRVRAVDPDGFVGFPSKIYAFRR